jgi:hypothetical protein
MYDTSCDIWSFGIIIGELRKVGRGGYVLSPWMSINNNCRISVPPFEEALLEPGSEKIREDLGTHALVKFVLQRNAVLAYALPELTSLVQTCLYFEPTYRSTFPEILAELNRVERCHNINKRREWPWRVFF